MKRDFEEKNKDYYDNVITSEAKIPLSNPWFYIDDESGKVATGDDKEIERMKLEIKEKDKLIQSLLNYIEEIKEYMILQINDIDNIDKK